MSIICFQTAGKVDRIPTPRSPWMTMAWCHTALLGQADSHSPMPTRSRPRSRHSGTGELRAAPKPRPARLGCEGPHWDPDWNLKHRFLCQRTISPDRNAQVLKSNTIDRFTLGHPGFVRRIILFPPPPERIEKRTHRQATSNPQGGMVGAVRLSKCFGTVPQLLQEIGTHCRRVVAVDGDAPEHVDPLEETRPGPFSVQIPGGYTLK